MRRISFEAERIFIFGEFVPELALENPEALMNIPDFQHAGSDITKHLYNGHREKMRVIGKEELLEP